MIEKYISVLVVFIVVILVGHICISRFMDLLNYQKNPYAKRDLIDQEIIGKKYAQMQSGILGIFERPLFLVCLLEGWFIVIGFWLTLKGVVIWKKWEEKNGRVFFNNFLIGNSINLLYSFCGYLALRFLNENILFNPINVKNILVMVIVLLIPYLLTLLTQKHFLTSFKVGEEKDNQERNDFLYYKETTFIVNQHSEEPEKRNNRHENCWCNILSVNS